MLVTMYTSAAFQGLYLELNCSFIQVNNASDDELVEKQKDDYVENVRFLRLPGKRYLGQLQIVD